MYIGIFTYEIAVGYILKECERNRERRYNSMLVFGAKVCLQLVDLGVDRTLFISSVMVLKGFVTHDLGKGPYVK